MAELSKAALATAIDDNVTVNGNNENTGLRVNDVMQDMADSSINKVSEKNYLFRRYDSGSTYAIGFIVVYDDGGGDELYEANTGTSGTFNVAHWDSLSLAGGGGGGGNGIYTASGTIPSAVVATLTDTFEFKSQAATQLHINYNTTETTGSNSTISFNLQNLATTKFNYGYSGPIQGYFIKRTAESFTNFRIDGTGKIGLNLNANGSASVQVRGLTDSDGDKAFLVENSSNVESFKVENDGGVFISVAPTDTPGEDTLLAILPSGEIVSRDAASVGGGSSIYSANDTIGTTRVLTIADTVQFGNVITFNETDDRAIIPHGTELRLENTVGEYSILTNVTTLTNSNIEDLTIKSEGRKILFGSYNGSRVKLGITTQGDIEIGGTQSGTTAHSFGASTSSGGCIVFDKGAGRNRILFNDFATNTFKAGIIFATTDDDGLIGATLEDDLFIRGTGRFVVSAGSTSLNNLLTFEGGDLSLGTQTATAKMHIVGATNTSATQALKVANSDNDIMIWAKNNQSVGILGEPTKPVHIFGETWIEHSVAGNIKHRVKTSSGNSTANAAFAVENDTGKSINLRVPGSASASFIDYRDHAVLHGSTGTSVVLSAATNGIYFVAEDANLSLGKAAATIAYMDHGDKSFNMGTITSDPKAIMNLVSTTKGFLPPRMTTAQKNGILTPPTGLVIFDTDLDKLAVYASGGWEAVTST